MICVVDDDPATCQAIQRLLGVHGYIAHSFYSASEFLRSQHMSDARCLILDIRMPGMSGIQLHQHLLLIEKHIPVIYITGYIDEDVKECFVKEETVSVLEKPFDADQLLKHVRTAMEKSA